LQTKDYGCVEFTIADPNGFLLVFSQEAGDDASPMSA
jgi:hypothetical protein